MDSQQQTGEQKNQDNLISRYDKARQTVERVRANMELAQVILQTNDQDGCVVTCGTKTPLDQHRFNLERSVLELESALRHAKQELDKLSLNTN